MASSTPIQSKACKISLCIPSSVISESNASNLEHITHITYQIAKAATIYHVCEIIVLDIPSKKVREERFQADLESKIDSRGDGGNKKIKFNISDEDYAPSQAKERPKDTNSSGTDQNENNSLLLASLLQYFVTPKYLVKSVFGRNPFVKKFKYANKLPKLSALPFMNKDVHNDFKEGFTISKKAPKVRKKNKKISAVKKLKVTKYVNIGEPKLLELSGAEVPTNVRVTVDVKNRIVVSPESAYGVSGCKASFGYHVRLAKTVTSVFTESSYVEGYTESVFVNADNYFNSATNSQTPLKKDNWHGQILMVIGNMRDLDYVFKQERIEGVDSINDMFDAELPVPSGLRIEDAALVSLAMV